MDTEETIAKHARFFNLYIARILNKLYAEPLADLFIIIGKGEKPTIAFFLIMGEEKQEFIFTRPTSEEIVFQQAWDSIASLALAFLNIARFECETKGLNTPVGVRLYYSAQENYSHWEPVYTSPAQHVHDWVRELSPE